MRRAVATRTLSLIVLLLPLVACQPRVDTRGNLPDPDRLAELKPGKQSRDEVAELLGTPSTTALFDQETWYYISKRTETRSFFAPEDVDRQVLVLQFDENGVLSDMHTLGLADGRPVEPVERTTPTSGNEFTVMEQLFGNIGRFSGEKKP